MSQKFLIVGANFENQGAFLMLATVAQELKARFGASAVVDMKLGTAAQRRDVGALTLAPGKVDRALPQGLRVSESSVLPERLRLVRHSEIDGVIDISGFRYGDQWANLNLDHFANRLKSLGDRGVPVYMFPQAFGPFERTAAPTLKAVRAARLVMVRDPDSAAFLRGILETEDDHSRVSLVSDFTGPTDGTPVPALEGRAGGVPIIPNWNIYSRASASDGDQYVKNIAALVELLREMGYQPYGLSHEGDRDVTVLTRVADRLGGLEIVSGLNGLELKWLIGQSPLLVAGRFHAISSGLSQGIPTLIHGWSHKYRWMASDYGVEQYAVDPYSPPDVQATILKRLAADSALPGLLRQRGAELDESIDRMWTAFAEDFALRAGQKQ
jgi:colanic acid/amylovoran biosynthesis protein